MQDDAVSAKETEVKTESMGKNLLVRTVVGLVLVSIAIGFLLLRELVNPLFFDLMLYIVGIGGTFEVVRALKEKLLKEQMIICVTYPVVVFPIMVFLNNKWATIASSVYVIILISLLVFSNKRISLENVGLSFLALLYPNLFIFMAHELNTVCETEILLLAVAIGPMTDTFALFVGIIFKGKKLCPTISPKKTVSGAIGGVFGGMLASFAVWLIFETHVSTGKYKDLILLLIVGFFGAIVTEIGDLVESQIKRKVGIKDMGKIFPGHGGIMDRIDGMMFCFAVIWILYVIVTPFVP